MSEQLLNGDTLLEGILGSISKIADTRDIDALLMEFSAMAHKLVPADRCTVWVYDAEKDILWSRVADGIPRIETSANDGFVGAVFRSGDPLIINDVHSDPRFNPDIDKKTGYTTRNMITIPLKNSDGNILGVFQSVNKLGAQEFTSEDLNLLLFVTVYIGREIDAAILREELEATQREIIYTLAEAAEMRSQEMGNHVKRVSEYCSLIAELIGLSEKQQELIRVASPLHDLGKIAIPDSILLKPGKLTAEERVVMETHAELGYKMLKHSHRRAFEAAANIAYQHHEKWDGTGYPNGTKGEEIHVFGRIAAVADVYDALANARCYKPAWEKERVIALFVEERGRHFDPQIVDVFLENQERFFEINHRFADVFPEDD